MLTQEQIDNLHKLNYEINEAKTYLFKTIHGEYHHQYTSIFIDIKTGNITFDGNDTHKDELLKEVEGVIKNENRL